MIDWREFNKMMDEMFSSPFNDMGWNKKSYKSPDGRTSYTFMSKGFDEEPKIDEVEFLKHKLEKCVALQNFEEAVQLRDKIKKLEENKEKISELKTKLDECVKNQDYEKAIEYRDKIRALK
jgi:protein-arginine kinase activator protein McsA